MCTCLSLIPASLATSVRGLPAVPWIYAAPRSQRTPDRCRLVRILESEAGKTGSRETVNRGEWGGEGVGGRRRRV